MSTTQELIERLKAWADRERDAARGFDDALSFAAMEACEITEGTLRAAADRLSEQAAELDALRKKLAGVDEKALEAAARILAGAATPTEMGDSGFNAYHRIEYAEICWRDHADRARAAIAAYLAAVRDKG